MLERARQLTPKELPADYVLADATVYPFDPESFDLLVSRFGVMFFADPVLSFRNLRKSLRPKGRLVFACWREPRENGWMMTPLMAVYKHVPKLPQLGPEDPGPFAFADEARVKRILIEAGFTDVAMEACPLSLRCRCGQRARCRRAGRARNRPRQPGAGRPSAGCGRRRDPVDPRGADAICEGTIGAAAGSDLAGHGARWLSPILLCMGLFSHFC